MEEVLTVREVEIKDRQLRHPSLPSHPLRYRYVKRVEEKD